ncbi:DUF4350 domain-containing protein [Demequina sp. NBRC 110057]|uniref:DUF4350 domain-containing protein n=1 Tax=Demequina sp. NBRC 110057 TaxID=1570346 RepID=UPI000A05DA99|nr:DUF4350 domain-containing protein [Demequina sp. NBRC 110057]
MSVTYARAEERPSVAQQARRRPVAIVAAILFVGLVAILVWSARPEDSTALSPDNPGTDGARAAAQILRDQGVEVRYSTTLGSIRVDDPASTTLVVAAPDSLRDHQIDALLAYPGDLVFLGTDDRVLTAAQTGMATAGVWGSTTTVPAACEDPDALAAGQIEVGPEAVAGSPSAGTTVCFLTGDGTAGYLDVERDAGRMTMLASAQIVTNDRLDVAGNASLTLHTLGRHQTVEWYVASLADASVPTWEGGQPVEVPDDVTLAPDYLPPGTLQAAFALALAVLVAALWRARRFGPLVREPLPVVVRASEATRGRARLYRRAGAAGRAGAALRAHAATRIGARLGVPRSASPDALVDAVARATGRRRDDVARVLYGPPPAGDAALMSLIAQLDALESEVHRP